MGNLKINPVTGRLDLIGSQQTGGTPIDNLRAGSETLSAGSHTIAFSDPFTANYRLVISCFQGTTQLPFYVTAKTANGFTVTVMDACTLDYSAIKDR